MPDDHSETAAQTAKRTNRRAMLRAGLTASVTVAGLYGLSRLIPEKPAPAGLAQILRDPDAPVLGNPQGDVTVVEYFDYQCSFCRSGHEAVMAAITADGNTRLLLRDWPIFGATSIYASQMVLGASAIGGKGSAEGLTHYGKAGAALMAIRGQLDVARIDAALSEAGVDPEAAMAGYQDSRRSWDSLMIRNDRQAMQMGFQGTPSFVIGTKTQFGVLSESALGKAIRRARAAGPITFAEDRTEDQPA